MMHHVFSLYQRTVVAYIQFVPEDCCCIQICTVGTKAIDVIDVCLFEIVHDIP